MIPARAEKMSLTRSIRALIAPRRTLRVFPLLVVLLWWAATLQPVELLAQDQTSSEQQLLQMLVQTPAQAPSTAQTPAPIQTVEQRMDDLIKALPNQKISVRFVDADITTVLRSLGRMANQNILINPSVKGTINTQIENTPWNEVFSGIVNTYGLIISKEGNLLRIMSSDDLKQQVARKALQLEQEQVSPLVTRIIGVEFSDPEQIAKTVTPLLTKKKDGSPRGSVSVDTHSRSLVIQDVQENIDQLSQYLVELDRSTPQILIEAHIIETSMDTARELGVEWNLAPAADTTGHFKFKETLPANTIHSAVPATIGYLGTGPAGTLLDLQLSALEQAGRVKILSRPSIATLDNKEAIIESGAMVPYQTIGQDGIPKIEYVTAVLRLTVVPHVISEHLIKLNIEAKKDEVDDTRSVANNPYIIKKLATTQLLVDNMSTVVIAGLSKEKQSDGTTGVPYLKDLPLLGALFRSNSKGNEFEELLIFITPKILSDRAPVAGQKNPARPAEGPHTETGAAQGE